MFNPNENPDVVAARAAELAIEQLDRLNAFLKNNPDRGAEFYKESFEIGISNQIAKLLGGYAVVKGLVPEDYFATKTEN
jgi:hypothetical protein